MPKPKIFITSSAEGFNVAAAIESHLHTFADITVWSNGTFQAGKTITESLSEVADRSDFAIVILSPDGDIGSRDSRWSPRQNVIFELGFLAGRLGLSRIFVVVTDPMRTVLPSDLMGILYVPLRADDRSDVRLSTAPAVAAIRRAMETISVKKEAPTEFSSCFISYSWNDKEFVAHLADDLQQAGVRCWLDAKEMRIGDSIHNQVDRAIQSHDKVLLVLSESSVKSPWVKHELRSALHLEMARHKTVLFPLRIDNSVLEQTSDVEFEVLKKKYITDFTNWQDSTQYRRAFSRLVRDLVISASAESGRGS